MYLDYNATTPLDPRVLEAMLPYLGAVYGNPSSVHRFGRLMRDAIEQAREQVARLVSAQTSEVIFTSGGTEANNLAIKGACAALKRGRLVISAVEHESLLMPARAMRQSGWEVDEIKVNGQGQVTETTLNEALHDDTRLVSIMAANNETGVIQDIYHLGTLVAGRGLWFHSDASQAAGKIPVDFSRLPVHLMTLSAHKLSGPLGVGALLVDKSIEIASLLQGGGQERGLRAGTENVAAIVGFGAAAEIGLQSLEQNATRLRQLREQLERQLSAIQGLVIFARDVERLPNTVQFAVPGYDGETLLMQLDRKGFAVSSGSACTSGKNEPSHVLVAMGVDPDLARGAVRVSLGKDNDEQDVNAFVAAVHSILGERATSAARVATV